MLALHMNMGQFLGFSFCLSLGTCLPKIALRLIILVEANDQVAEISFLCVEVTFGPIPF